MRILGILPESIGGRLTTSSMLDGFRMLGHNVVVYDKLNPDKIDYFGFDYIASYDFTGIKFKVDNKLSIKTINYFSDEIRNKTSGAYWKDYIDELENVFYWDRELSKKEKNVIYLPHFVNTEIYKNTNPTPQYDVMFAGRLDTDYRLKLIEHLIENNINLCWYAIDRHYQDVLTRTKYPEQVKKIYKGFIDNEPDMAKAINDTKIVINMNSQGVSSLNYRTMQTIACERLLISDKRAELDLFDNKIPTYSSIEEISELINHYLKTDYSNITQHCARICRERHNSKVGVEFILSKVR